jgi:hypothetical protein
LEDDNDIAATIARADSGPVAGASKSEQDIKPSPALLSAA